MTDRARSRFFARVTPAPQSRVEPTVNEGVATIRLYDVIDSWGGEWGVSAVEFAAALDGLPADTSEIRLHLNSPGGEVFEGVAIHSLLRQHPASVTVVVDALAASAASFIAMAGDRIVMTPYAQMMIHDAWGYASGNAAVMRDIADRLDHLSDTSAAMYAARAGGTVADWRTAMIAETWYSADEAVAAGLADEVGEPTQDTSAQMAYDLSPFRWNGRAEAPAPAALAVIEPDPEPTTTDWAHAHAARVRQLDLADADAFALTAR